MLQLLGRVALKAAPVIISIIIREFMDESSPADADYADPN
jgi:hypothetical protein